MISWLKTTEELLPAMISALCFPRHGKRQCQSRMLSLAFRVTGVCPFDQKAIDIPEYTSFKLFLKKLAWPIFLSIVRLTLVRIRNLLLLMTSWNAIRVQSYSLQKYVWLPQVCMLVLVMTQTTVLANVLFCPFETVGLYLSF